MGHKKNISSYHSKQLHIIKTALTLFASKGFDGTSVRDIAMASKVNLAMINYYFGSKLQLLEAIFLHMGTVSKQHLDSVILEDGLTPFQKLDKLIDAYIQFAIENRDFMILLMRQQFTLHNNDILALIDTLKNRYWRIFFHSLQEAKKVHIFRQDADITIIASIVMGTLNFLISDKPFLSKISNISKDNDSQYNDEVIKKCMNQVKTMIEEYLVVKA